MIKKFAYSSNERLSNGFTVSEFRCKCGKKHDTIIDTELIDKLEKLRAVLGCSKIVVNSGYRCSSHDKAVGGNGEGQHTKGTAADIKCYGKDGKVINTKYVACTAQDIGFRGIGNIDKSYTAIHVDVRSGKEWFGDEAVSGGTAHSVTDNFNAYYFGNHVSDLQKILNSKGAKLAVDGIAGSKTLAECHKYSVHQGDKGSLTKWVQERLNALGYNCGTPDGIAGAKTMTAIHNFQQAHKLGVGYLGGTDWDKLV